METSLSNTNVVSHDGYTAVYTANHCHDRAYSSQSSSLVHSISSVIAIRAGKKTIQSYLPDVRAIPVGSKMINQDALIPG